MCLMDTLATALNTVSTALSAKHSLCCPVSTVAGKPRAFSSLRTPPSASSGALHLKPTNSLCPLSWRMGTALRPPIRTTHHASFSADLSAASPRGPMQQVPSLCRPALHQRPRSLPITNMAFCNHHTCVTTVAGSTGLMAVITAYCRCWAFIV